MWQRWGGDQPAVPAHPGVHAAAPSQEGARQHQADDVGTKCTHVRWCRRTGLARVRGIFDRSRRPLANHDAVVRGSGVTARDTEQSARVRGAMLERGSRPGLMFVNFLQKRDWDARSRDAPSFFHL